MPPATYFLVLAGTMFLFMPILTVQQKQENPVIEFATKLILVFLFMAIGAWAFFKQPQMKKK